MVTPCIPASSVAFPLARTYTALARSSPTSTTASPGVTPRAPRPAAARATSARTAWAMATPSINSAGKIHRPRLANHDHLNLARILEFGLNTTGDLLGQRRHPGIVDVLGRDHHSHLTSRLDGEHLVH